MHSISIWLLNTSFKRCNKLLKESPNKLLKESPNKLLKERTFISFQHVPVYASISTLKTQRPIYNYIKVGASCTLNISFKHTTGDYLDVEHPLKPLKKSLMKLQKNLHNNNQLKITTQHMHPNNIYQLRLSLTSPSHKVTCIFLVQEVLENAQMWSLEV